MYCTYIIRCVCTFVKAMCVEFINCSPSLVDFAEKCVGILWFCRTKKGLLFTKKVYNGGEETFCKTDCVNRGERMFQIKWLLKHMDKKFLRLTVVGIGISILTSMMQLVDPWLTSRLYDDVIMTGNADPLIPILMAMLVVTVVRVCARYGMIVMLEKASQNMLMNLRHKLFRRLQYQDVSYFDTHRTGDLITRMQGDLNYCRHVMAYSIFQITDHLTLLIAAFVLFFCYSPKLTLILLVVIPLTMAFITMYRRRVRDNFHVMRERMAEMNTAAQENISGNRVVKAFVREDYERERFEKRNEAFREIHLTINKAWLRVLPLMESLVVLMTLKQRAKLMTK